MKRISLRKGLLILLSAALLLSQMSFTVLAMEPAADSPVLISTPVPVNTLHTGQLCLYTYSAGEIYTGRRPSLPEIWVMVNGAKDMLEAHSRILDGCELFVKINILISNYYTVSLPREKKG